MDIKDLYQWPYSSDIERVGELDWINECYEKAIISAREFIDNYFKHNYLRQF